MDGTVALDRKDIAVQKELFAKPLEVKVGAKYFWDILERGRKALPTAVRKALSIADFAAKSLN